MRFLSIILWVLPVLHLLAGGLFVLMFSAFGVRYDDVTFGYFWEVGWFMLAHIFIPTYAILKSIIMRRGDLIIQVVLDLSFIVFISAWKCGSKCWLFLLALQAVTLFFYWRLDRAYDVES